MQFSKLIFNKDLYDLTIDDILEFFSSEQEESSILEFKAGKVEVNDIHREVSAFLNTEGGLLIIGAPKEEEIPKGKNKVKVCKGDPMPSTRIKNQDNLMRSISSNISPAPTKIRAKEIPFKEGNIYILEIPQSVTPPHQVSNEGKYYIRLERDSKPAPHGIVEALFFKRQKPDLDVAFNISNEHKTINRTIFIDFLFSNDSYVTAENINYIITIGGVKEIKSTNNVHSEPELKNDILRQQSNHTNFILVKGIDMPVTFELELKDDFCIIECTFFCKDTFAERKICILNLKDDIEFTHTYNSKKSNNNNTPEELYDHYIKLRQQQS
ncbi:MAG: helix-turn-helix domain-containing protein [Marinifilaceae bacterium]